MTENHTTGIEPATVECAVCKKLIPPSEAISPEAHEYVLICCSLPGSPGKLPCASDSRPWWASYSPASPSE